MLLDRPNRPPHYKWLATVLLGTVVALAWFWLESRDSSEWPGGSSFPGFTFGVIGGLIILFECFLWVRKRWLRVWRIGKAQSWLRAHIWLGLFCLPLLILHSGVRWGGWLSAVLMALLIVVVVSGIIGLILQNVLPTKMLEEIPGETIYSQIDTLASQLVAEADRLVSATCGTKAQIPTEVSDTAYSGPIVVGAVRTVGSVQGVVLGRRIPTASIPETEPLANFFRDQVKPFLEQGVAGNPKLAYATQAAALFQDIRLRIPLAAHDAIAVLEEFCAQRRRWDRQARLHFWLHSWLWVHLPLSAALLVLTVVHVFVALKYW